jgi:uncharacterized protein
MRVAGYRIGDEVRELILPLISDISRQSDVIAIIIFGSVVNGKAREDSDIDLCIVTRPDISDSARLELLSYGWDRIDIHLFRDLPLTIRMRVIREGELLFCADTLLFHRIKIDTIREYLDFSHIVRRHCLHALRINQ